jgi:hypothetical protein
MLPAQPPFFLRSLQRYLRAEAITVGVERKLVVVRRTGSRRDQAGEVEAADTQSADIGSCGAGGIGRAPEIYVERDRVRAQRRHIESGATRVTLDGKIGPSTPDCESCAQLTARVR